MKDECKTTEQSTKQTCECKKTEEKCDSTSSKKCDS